MVKLGRSVSFRVRAGVKTSLVTDSENRDCVDGTVALPDTVPSSLDGKPGLRYRQDLTVHRLDGMASRLWIQNQWGWGATDAAADCVCSVSVKRGLKVILPSKFRPRHTKK